MKFINQAAVSIGTQAVTQAIVMITGFIMPRLIAPPVKGQADLIMNLSLPLIVFSNLGIQSAILYHPDRNKTPIGVIASTSLTTALIVGSAVALACGLFLPEYYASRHSQIIEPWHVGLVLVTTPLQIVTSYLNVTQLVAGRVIGFNFIQFLPTFLYVTVFFGIYLILGPDRFEQTPQLFLTSMVAARVAQWVVSSLVAVAMLRGVADFKPAVDWGFLREALRFGLRPYFRDVFQWLTLGFTLYYLEIIHFDAADLGFWSIAVTAMQAVWQVPETLHMVLANRIATHTLRDRHWFTPMACRNILFITFTVALAIGLAAEVILRFWAPRYVGAVPAVRILLAGSVVFCLFKILQTDLLARGEKNIVPILSGATFALIVLLNIFAVTVLGWRSIAVAAGCSAIAMSLAGIFTLIHYCQLSQNPILRVILVGREDVEMWVGFARNVYYRIAHRKPAP